MYKNCESKPIYFFKYGQIQLFDYKLGNTTWICYGHGNNPENFKHLNFYIP